MKKTFITCMVMLFIFAMFYSPGCKKKPASTIKEIELLKLIPGETSGLFCFDTKRLNKIEFFKGKIEDLKKNKEKTGEEKSISPYGYFVEKTGIDFEKDVRSLVIALFPPGSDDMKSAEDINALALVDLKYDKEKILSFLDEKRDEKKCDYEVKTYNDTVIIKLKNATFPIFFDRTVEDAAFSFIDKKIIAVGKVGLIKKVIDIAGGKGKNVLVSAELKPFLETKCSDVSVSFAILVPEKMKKPFDQGLFQLNLSDAKIVSGNIDQIKSVWEGEFRLVSSNTRENSQLASILAFLKTVVGTTLGVEFSEVINNIRLTSSETDVKLMFSMPHELLIKLFKKIQNAGFNVSILTGENS